jgi:hypothetical protein
MREEADPWHPTSLKLIDETLEELDLATAETEPVGPDRREDIAAHRQITLRLPSPTVVDLATTRAWTLSRLGPDAGPCPRDARPSSTRSSSSPTRSWQQAVSRTALVSGTKHVDDGPTLSDTQPPLEGSPGATTDESPVGHDSRSPNTPLSPRKDAWVRQRLRTICGQTVRGRISRSRDPTSNLHFP